MALLKIYKNSELIESLQLESEHSYTIGRGDNCDYRLDAEPGISRQHFRVVNIEGAWKVMVLSRYGEVYLNKTQTSDFYLQEGIEFSVPPYTFEFTEESPLFDIPLADTHREEAIIPPTDESVNDSMNEPASEPSFSDRTRIMPGQPDAQLILLDSSQKALEKIILRGEQWTVGRDSGCEINIDRPRFSRRHFELKKYEGNYFIRDLGSSNGTIVNGRVIESSDWTLLNSGDQIQVADWYLEFLIVDSEFSKKIQQIDPALLVPAVAESPSPLRTMPQPMYNNYPDYPISSVSRKSGPNWVRLVSLSLIAAAVIYYGIDQQAQKPTEKPSVAKGSGPFDKLSPEQKTYVKQTYNAGRQLFMQGKYESARQEMISLHQVIAQYEDSKQIQEMATQALATIEEQRKLEMREQEKGELEVKINKQVAACRASVNEDIEMSQIESCLAPVIQFNPDHPMIVKLKGDVEKIQLERKIREANRADYAEKLRKQKSLFEQAQKLNNSGEALQAIKAYERVIGSPYPDPQGYKGEAKRQIASLQQKISDRQVELDQKAESARKSGKWKEAMLALNEALKINPDNEVIRGRIESVMGDLRKQMQVLYQEAILEESVGEVDTAKARWKKIIEQSVPEEEYYKKARIKLKKYGAI